MMKRNYKMKKTISVKQFIDEFGGEFSKHMKQRLLELGERCILTRRELSYILDLKHIEHTKYEVACGTEGSEKEKKEYAFGQLVMKEGKLYFSKNCVENDDVMQISAVDEIFSALSGEEIQNEEGNTAKIIDDSNIDFVVDSILKVCPKVSDEHMAILAKYSTVTAVPAKR